MAGRARFAFAGDRELGVRSLELILEQGDRPSALLLAADDVASHAVELRERCSFLPDERVFTGDAVRTPEAMERLRGLDLDFVLAVHYPHLVRRELLDLPRLGFLNMHPALLPFNRGWHTQSWALLEGTPIGATLHVMSEGVDEGDVILQRELAVGPDDTAHSLYARLCDLEVELLREAWPALSAAQVDRRPQDLSQGSAHRRRELFADEVQRIDLDETVTAEALLRRLRALTTNDLAEAAWFEVGGRRYRVQVTITPDPGI